MVDSLKVDRKFLFGLMFCLGYFLAQESNPACLSKIVRYSMYLLDVPIIYMQIQLSHSFGGFLLSDDVMLI